MLGVLLGIGKVLLWILLIILGLILLLLAVLLFVPFGYDAAFELDNPSLKALRLEGGISWLFTALKVRAFFKEQRLTLHLSIFGISLDKLGARILGPDLFEAPPEKEKKKGRGKEDKSGQAEHEKAGSDKSEALPEISKESEENPPSDGQANQGLSDASGDGAEKKEPAKKGQELKGLEETGKKAFNGPGEIQKETPEPVKEPGGKEQGDAKDLPFERSDVPPDEEKASPAVEAEAKSREKNSAPSKRKGKAGKKKAGERRKKAPVKEKPLKREPVKGAAEQKVPLTERVRSAIASFVKKIKDLKARIDGLIEKAGWLKRFLAAPETKGTIGLVKKALSSILKSIAPRVLDGDLRLGFADPSMTGWVLAVFGMTMPFHKNRMRVKPVFEADSLILSGSGMLKGRVFLSVFAFWIIRFLLSKDVKTTYKRWKSKEDIEDAE